MAGCLVALLALLIICNLAFVSSHGWGRLIWSLAGYLGLFAVCAVAQLRFADIGLSRQNFPSGLRFAAYVILAIVLVFAAILLVDHGAFKDPRYDQSLPKALDASLVLLPLKTVFFEELAFRGIFLALLTKLKAGRWLANITSSVAFGLWHIGSTSGIGSYKLSAGVSVSQSLIFGAVLLFTTVAGLLLCELRWRSKSLLAPIAAHWFANCAGILIAAFSWR